MNQNAVIAIVVVLLAIVLLLILVRSRRQAPVRDLAAPAAPEPTMRRTPTPECAPETPVLVDAPPEGRGIAGEAAAAADVVGAIIGVDAHPDLAAAPPAHPGDPLTRLKGLGPRAEATLHALGVTSYAQIAAWNAEDVAAIDAQMGGFKGRIVRDQWVDQARLLASGDVAGFEARYGKLG